MGMAVTTRSVFYRLSAPLREVHVTRVHLLLVSLFILFFGQILLSPFKSTLLTNYFGEWVAGHPIQCTDLPPGKRPPEACKSAHTYVWNLQALESAVCNLFLTVVLTPLFCRWSDKFGRKPFILYGMSTNVLPTMAILCYLLFGLPMWWYYPAAIINSAFSEYSVVYAYVSDVISPRHRTLVFGLTSTPFGLALLLSPMPTILGWLESPLVAAIIALVNLGVSLLIVLFLVPESLSEETKCAAAASGLSYSRSWKAAIVFDDFWGTMKILVRTEYFLKLAICTVILYTTMHEVHDVEHQYLQEVAGFGTKDQARIMSIAGGFALFAQSVGMWILTDVLSLPAKQILILGFAGYLCKMILLSICKSKAVAYAAVAAGGTIGLVFPSVASIKSTYVSDSEQGAVQGALGGVQALGKGIGPLLFATIFYGFRHGHIYFPGAPFVVCSVLVFVGLVVAVVLKLPPVHTELPSVECTEQRLLEANPLLDENQNKY